MAASPGRHHHCSTLSPHAEPSPSALRPLPDGSARVSSPPGGVRSDRPPISIACCLQSVLLDRPDLDDTVGSKKKLCGLCQCVVVLAGDYVEAGQLLD